MKSIIRCLVLAAFVVAAGSASAQPAPQGSGGQTTTGTAGSAAVAPEKGTAPIVPPVSPADKGAAQGTGPEGAQSPGPSTQPTGSPDGAGGSDAGSAANVGSAAGSAAPAGAGSAAPAGAGSAAPAGGQAGVAWYDVLANKPIEESGTFWMPKSVNEAADDSDLMFYSVLALSAIFFFAITIAVVYFAVKYRHRPGHKPQPSAAHNDALEITWTVIPTIIVVFLFWYGWRSYIRVVTPPQKAVEIQVLAWRWNWQFTHANGVTDSDLHVPVNTPVRLVMTSKDVLHSFYAPAMRVKQDLVPRRYTYAWFKATKPGTYRLTCAEYCGTSHAQMACLETDKHTGSCLRRAVVVVHSPGDYERYLADKAANMLNMAPVDLGKLVYEKKGCNACHTVDGSARVGPTWKGSFGTTVPLSDGTSAKVDENYIRESMMAPQAKLHQGYPPSMPSFEGQLKEKEIEGVIEYMKSLK
ncbi:MAG TPA: cytochrome c oxidase subunit II [Kofleriaceae bacterium]|nr:cytochrome c oxidase subunit II [Kofleriaceae bacterium]